MLERQGELDEAEASIKALIDHLDVKKEEAIERTFKMVARNFTQGFSELVPGGTGKLVMSTSAVEEGAPAESGSAAARVAGFTGIKVHVSFTGGGDTQTMEQLSGGQKTMTALCLIFAIQRCDPAPFYIFDEVDANLDATHRASLAKMIEKQASEVDDKGEQKPSTQFITTTFRPAAWPRAALGSGEPPALALRYGPLCAHRCLGSHRRLWPLTMQAPSSFTRATSSMA